MSLRNLGCKLDYLLEVFAGCGEVAALDRRVAGVEGIVGLMKLFLTV